MLLQKDEGHPITKHEGPEKEKRYSSTRSLTSAVHVDMRLMHTLATLCPGKKPITHCTEGQVDFGAVQGSGNMSCIC